MPLIDDTIASIRPLDGDAMDAARGRQQTLTKPPGSLGRLEDLSVWLAGVQRSARPRIDRPVIVVAAGDHGVAARGVSAYPREVTGQMVLNFLAGGAAVNVLARQTGARVVVVDAGVASGLPPHPELVSRRAGPGTNDIAEDPAMAHDTARLLVEQGINLALDLAADGAGAIAVGDMGIGNTTPSAAIVSACTGLSPAAVTGYGTGISPEQHTAKVLVVEQALAVNSPDPTDGIDLLAKVGGFEIGLLAGVMIGGAAASLPVILDGFITTAAALVARALAPEATAYFVAAHRSVEMGHMAALDLLGLEPLLDLRLRLGEASGAALALPLLRAACAILDEMATFDEAGVSNSDMVQTNET
jgi:nicotinate-nucleotide--dimethylbenzimidazole phosphoribosyltransferase